MEVLLQIFLAGMVLVFIAELAADVANTKHKVLTAAGIYALCAGIVHFMGVTKLDSIFSAFVVAGFLFSGSYLVFSGIRWLRS